MITKTYKVQFHRDCLKDLKQVPIQLRSNIQKRINELSIDPRPNGCKKLRGSDSIPLYRIRCGDYRIIYTIQDEILLILISEIGHRREIYRGL